MKPIMYADGVCPKCGKDCGNGGYGGLKCKCGWREDENNSKYQRLQKRFEEL